MSTTTPSASSLLAQIRERAFKAALLIDTCNYLPKEDALEALKADAVASHLQHPQYNGHWDGFVLARVKKAVRTKMGVAFEKGDLALVQTGDHTLGADAVTAYSNRNGCDTALRAKDIEIVR
jgi:hypothetical protein